MIKVGDRIESVEGGPLASVGTVCEVVALTIGGLCVRVRHPRGGEFEVATYAIRGIDASADAAGKTANAWMLLP